MSSERGNMITNLVMRYSKDCSEGAKPKVFFYGEEGICCREFYLEDIAFRMSVMCSMKSIMEQGRFTGISITSHKPLEHVVFTLYDSHGDQMNELWLQMINEYLNFNDDTLTVKLKRQSVPHPSRRPSILIGCDFDCLPKGVLTALAVGPELFCGRSKFLKKVTSCQMRYFLNHKRLQSTYYKEIAINEKKYFNDVRSMAQTLFENPKKCTQNYQKQVQLDFACGLASEKYQQVRSCFKSIVSINTFNRYRSVKPISVGSNYVFLLHKLPDHMTSPVPGHKCVSFDHQGTRLVYYYQRAHCDKLRLLDGSRMAVLFALYIQDLMISVAPQHTLVVVQTLTSNSASSSYLENRLRVHVRRVPASRMSLLREAVQHDVALVFDEEGFGCLHLSQTIIDQVLGNLNCPDTCYQRMWALYQLFALNKGDALIAFIATEAILRHFDMSIKDWAHMYSNRCQYRFDVKYKRVARILMSTDGQRCLRPAGLQNAIDYHQSKWPGVLVWITPFVRKKRARVVVESGDEERSQSFASLVKQVIESYLV